MIRWSSRHSLIDWVLPPQRRLVRCATVNSRSQRFGAEVCKLRPLRQRVRPHQIDRAKTPRIAQGKAMRVCLQKAGGSCASGVSGSNPPAPAHAEMEDHRRAAIKMDQSVFGPPRKAGHLRPGHHLHQIGREGAAQIGAGFNWTRVIRAPSRNRARPRTVVSNFRELGAFDLPLTPFASAAIVSRERGIERNHRRNRLLRLHPGLPRRKRPARWVKSFSSVCAQIRHHE